MIIFLHFRNVQTLQKGNVGPLNDRRKWAEEHVAQQLTPIKPGSSLGFHT